MSIIKSVILALLLFITASVYANSITLQRYAFVGGNADGTVVAVMLSHFGPSSAAPFAKLMVKEVNQAEPLLVDSAMKFSGGEKDLAELCQYLIKKHATELKQFGIEFSNDFITEANAVNLASQTAGWIDIENAGVHSFAVQSKPLNACANPQGMTLNLILDDRIRLSIQPSANECWDDAVSVRNVYRTKKALWFILNKHTLALNSLDAYWIDVQGITE